MENVKYIPGDLVKINGKTNIIDGIYSKSFSKDRVIEAYAIEGDNTNRYRYDLDFGRIVSIDPIPLTPEILEKNGWSKKLYWDNYYWCLNINDYSKIGISFNQDGVLNSGFITEDPYERDMNAFANIPNLGYVHELQHLLFGLRLDNNLKI